MQAADDVPEDVKRASPVANQVQKGEKDDKNEEYPRIREKRRKWEHCNDLASKKPKAKTERSGSCCQRRRKRNRNGIRKEQELTRVSVFEAPCTLPRRETVPRHCLSKKEHCDLLAQPSPKCPSDSRKKSELRRLRPTSQRVKELAKPRKQRILVALREGATKLPASLLDNLINALEKETCLTPEQATRVAVQSKNARRMRKKTGKKEARSNEWDCKETAKTKKFGATNATTFDQEATICQYLIAERFVKSILKWKCSTPRDEFYDIAQVLIRRLTCALEYAPSQGEDRKSQQIRLLADVVACWIAGVISEVAQDHEKEIVERCKKKEEERAALALEDSDEDEDEEDEILEARRDYEDFEDDEDEGGFETRTKGKEATDVTDVPVKSEVEEDTEKTIETTETIKTEPVESLDEEEEPVLGAESVKTEPEDVEMEKEGEPEGKVGIGSEAEMEQAMDQYDQQAKVGLETAEDSSAEADRGQEEPSTVIEDSPVDATAMAQAEAKAEADAEVKVEFEDAKDEAEPQPEAERAELLSGDELKEEVEPEEPEEPKETEEAEEVKDEQVERDTEGKPPGDEPVIDLPTEGEGKGDAEQAELLMVSDVSTRPQEETVSRGGMDKKTAIDDLLKTNVPFLTFGKILDAIYNMVAGAPENTGTDSTINRIHRAIYEKLGNIIQMEDPEFLTPELASKLDVTCGKIATWLKMLLSESQIAFMESYMPEVESKELRDWMKWLCYVSDVANDWNIWLHRVIEKTSEMQAAEMTRGAWQDWTKSVDSGAILWRLFHLQTKHRARHNATMFAGHRVVPTGTLSPPNNKSERLIRTTDLHA